MNQFASTNTSGLLKSDYQDGEDTDKPVTKALKKKKAKLRDKILSQLDTSDEREKGDE